jgi:(2R)-sulfolactate sulfo-lyase subunit alpha
VSEPSAAILLHPEDNVLVCRTPIRAGDEMHIDGLAVVIRDHIEVGHKIARRPILPGEKIIKYGAPIGSATAPVEIGGHVHLHNMKSDYIASHTREAV